MRLFDICGCDGKEKKEAHFCVSAGERACRITQEAKQGRTESKYIERVDEDTMTFQLCEESIRSSIPLTFFVEGAIKCCRMSCEHGSTKTAEGVHRIYVAMIYSLVLLLPNALGRNESEDLSIALSIITHYQEYFLMLIQLGSIL